MYACQPKPWNIRYNILKKFYDFIFTLKYFKNIKTLIYKVSYMSSSILRSFICTYIHRIMYEFFKKYIICLNFKYYLI